MIRKAYEFVSLTILVMAIASMTNGLAAPAKGAPPQTVNLQVEIVGTADTYAVYSDGKGPYVNGVDGMVAQITSGGGLVLDFPDGATAVRKVNFNYLLDTADPCPPIWTFDPLIIPPGWTCDQGLANRSINPVAGVSVSISGISSTAIQNLAKDQAATFKWYWEFPDPNAAVAGSFWRLSFHSGYADYVGNLNYIPPYPDSPAWYVNVTCTGLNSSNKCNVWEVEPAKLNATTPPVALLNYWIPGSRKTPTQVEPSGFYYMPFKLILTAK
jgi:hypothetical protein